jgi:anti-anti-sigma regulatory factor
VRYFDSLGFRLLFDVKKQLQQRRCALLLVVPERAPIRRLFAIVNIDRYAEMHATFKSALAACPRAMGVAAGE